MWIKIGATIVNLNNIVAVQNEDELGVDYKGLGWMRLVVVSPNPYAIDRTTTLDYIYFPDKPYVRSAYKWIVDQCAKTFEE